MSHGNKPEEVKQDINEEHKHDGINPKTETNLGRYLQEIKYVDDTNIYKQKIHFSERLEYWRQLLIIPSKKRRKVPDDVITWVGEHRSDKFEVELKNFPRCNVIMLRVVVSPFWDYLYILLFFVWILLVTAMFLNLGQSYVRIIPINILILPLGGMFLSQLVPIIGVIYYVPCCNDLIRLMATKDFGFWAVTAVLLAQYLEFRYYGGQGLSHTARKCRIEKIENLVPNSPPKPNLMRRGYLGRWRAPKIFPVRGRAGTGTTDLQLKSLPADGVEIKVDSVEAIDITMDPTQREPESLVIEVAEEGQIPEGGEHGTSSSVTVMNNAVPTPTNDTVLPLNKDLPIEQVDGESSALELVEKIVSSTELSPLDTQIQEPPAIKVGFLRRKQMEKEAAEMKAKAEAAEKQRQIESLCTDWLEWKCLICGKENRRPRIPPKDYGIVFRERGIRVKRNLAIFIPRPISPLCTHCKIPANYRPPLGTSHLFSHYEDRERAFKTFPRYPKIHAAMPKFYNLKVKAKAKFLSLLWGRRDSPASGLLSNDWRLPIFLAGHFKEVPRPDITVEDYYEVGETVECRTQKLSWCRAKIINVHNIHTYDIRYNNGVELRFVNQSELRPPAAKGRLAYQTELVFIICVLTFPLGMMAALAGYSQATFLPVLLGALWMFVLHLLALIRDLYRFAEAGCVGVATMRLVFILPMLLLLVASALPVQGFSWLTVAAAMAAALLCFAPALYLAGPHYLIMIQFLVLQLAVLMISCGLRLDYGPGKGIPIAPAAPGLAICMTLYLYRRYLGYVWDVTLTIRPQPKQPQKHLLTELKRGWRYVALSALRVRKRPAPAAAVADALSPKGNEPNIERDNVKIVAV